MLQTVNQPITHLLSQWHQGEQWALDKLMPLIYKELYKRAGFALDGGAGKTLSPTALVNEAYLRLFHDHSLRWENRNHFFAIAAKAMRNVVRDYFKSRGTLKRGADKHIFSPEDLDALGAQQMANMVPLADAIEHLGQRFPREMSYVELHYFAGLNQQEIAGAMDVSVPTVKRGLRLAKSLLRKQMAEQSP